MKPRKLRIPRGGKLPTTTRLKALPAAQRAQVMALLRQQPYADAVAPVAELVGFPVKAAHLAEFFGWQAQQERLENYNRLTEQFEEFYQKVNPQAGRDKVRDMAIAFFMAEATANNDRDGFVDVAQLDLRQKEGATRAQFEERKLSLKEQQYRDQVAERKRAIEAELRAANSSGGITPETRERIERELKLL